MTYVGTDITLGGQSTRDFSKTRTRNYSTGGTTESDNFGNNDYVDSNGYLRETMNFNITENNNTNNKKIRQRGADTLQSLTDLDRSKSDVDGKWDPNDTNWYFVNTNFQGTNGSGGSVRNAANKGTFSIAVENWDPYTNVITNKIEGSATVAKD